MSWERAAPLADLAEHPVLFKKSPLQIAIFKVGENVFAIDNRCPHEGYPLVQGTVDSNCVLTCNWHNWKFRLQDGQCILGGDNVRHYPVKVDEGQVWIDATELPADELQAAILGGLQTAFERRDFARICREISRLRFNKLDPLLAVEKAIEWSHDRLEFGTTHAFAAAADWLVRARGYGDWERQLICLAEPVDHISFDTLRHKRFPYAKAGNEFDQREFLVAVDAEQRETAEAMVLRGLDDGLHWQDMEEAFAKAALAHYNDFGHSLIYVYKTGQLVETLGSPMERYLLPALARSICYATREDLIPEFKRYAATLESLDTPGSSDSKNISDLVDVFPASINEAFDWVARHIASYQSETLYQKLLAGLAKNLLQFNTSYQDAFDRSVNDSVGWLNLTHGVTFANAVHVMCLRYPQLWPQGLLQMACFLGRNRRFLDLELDENQWLVENAVEFFDKTYESLLDHGQRDPIFSAHLLKTTVAVEEELPSATGPAKTYLLAGLNRFLNSPIKQKHTRRLARQAVDLVQRDF